MRQYAKKRLNTVPVKKAMSNKDCSRTSSPEEPQ